MDIKSTLHYFFTLNIKWFSRISYITYLTSTPSNVTKRCNSIYVRTLKSAFSELEYLKHFLAIMLEVLFILDMLTKLNTDCIFLSSNKL